MGLYFRLSCIFLLICFALRTISICPREPYQNKCSSRGSEKHPDSSQTICNCDEVMYCAVIEVSSQCNLTLITLKGLPSNTSHNELYCNLASIGSEGNGSGINISMVKKGEVQADFMKIVPGKYKITCKQRKTNTECKIVKVSPRRVIVDEHAELELSLHKSSNCNSSKIWCFVTSPDNDTEILEASWIAENKIKCSSLTLTVLGKFKVWLDNLDMKRKNMEENGENSVEVYGKKPIAEQAEYSSDFQSIYVYFDQNIEISSECKDVFSKESQDHFGKDFTCSTRGNILEVKMGVDFTMMNHLEIVTGNGVYRAGNKPFLSASPASLQVSEKRVLSPTLSLFLSNPACGTESNEKYINIEAVALKSQKLTDYHAVGVAKSAGKSHRENLIIWRIIRQLQHKISYRIASFHSDATHLLHSFENLERLETFMDGEGNISEPGLISTDLVSVVVKSPPAPSMIIAEANVTFCRNTDILFKYRWSVNEENIEEEGKLLIVKDLPPGKYIIACLVVAYNSTEILGQGWTTTEIIDQPDNSIIYPTELVVGETNSFFLQSFSWRYNAISWTCKSDQSNANELCYSVDQRLLSEVVNLDSSKIRIPAGTLKPGRYTWTINNGEKQKTAKVTIKAGNAPVVHIDKSSVVVNSAQKVVIKVTVSQLQPECLIWWSSVRQKGYDYVNLKSIGAFKIVKTNEGQSQKNVTFIIPSSNMKWKGLKPDSSYLFKLQVVCPDSTSYIKIPILVNDPPVVSQLKVEPEKGKALITEFVIHKADANDQIEDYPLIFKWSYVDICGTETEIGRGAFPKPITTYLPPGELRVVLEVCDVRQSCSIASSPVIKVYQFGDIPRENFEKVLYKMQYVMGSGDILEAFGLAKTIFRSLSLTPETEMRNRVYAVVTRGIVLKIRDLTERLKKDFGVMEKSLKFLDQAMSVAKYFRKGSDIFQDLADFKNTILTKPDPKRNKRSSGSMPFESTFRFHSLILEKNDTIQNRMAFLKDVQKYMLKACAESLSSFSTESPMVNITMVKLEPVKGTNTSLKFHDDFVLNISGKISKQKVCLVVAQFHRDLLGNTNESRLTKLYEVQAIKKGKFIQTNKSNSTTLAMTVHVRHPPQYGLDCMMWTKTRGWSLKCSFRSVTGFGVTCHCKEFGYFAVFLRYASTEIDGTSSIKVEKWDATVEFKINEDYDSTVEGNPKSFGDSLKQQIADQMTIPSKAVSGLYITPGSVIVTIFFIDVRDLKAESIVKELVTRLHNGDLHFKHPISVDVQSVQIMIPKSKSSDSWKVRIAAYATIAAVTLTIILTATYTAFVRKKNSRIAEPISKSSLMEHPPIYRQFREELSLNGSSLRRRTSTPSRK